MSTPFSHIPGVRTTILDGSLLTARTSTQGRIVLLGSASSGPTGELISVYDATTIERKYGADSEIMKKTHECLAAGANSLRLMRIGGTEGSVVVEDSAGGTLTITPSYRDNEILDRYALIIENDGSINRFIVYDVEDSTYVYDSMNSLVIDTGIIEVVDDGLDLFTLNDRTDLTSAIVLGDLITGDFTVDGTATISSVNAIDGTDGTDNSLVEKYAALSAGYFSLDYKDGDYVVPVGVYLDDANIADDSALTTYGYFWLGTPAAASANDKLGYLWQYVYQGAVYTYFTDTPTYFSVSKVAATVTVNTNLVITALKAGKGGNACTIQIAVSGSGGPTVTIAENANGGLDILVTDDGTHTTSAAVTAINNALVSYITSTGVKGSTLLLASGGAGTALVNTAKTSLAGGAGGHVLTHAMLTGEVIPSAVVGKFAAGSDSQLRECNFAHQLASFCNLASINWKMMTGVISAKAPTGYSRTALSEYVGSLPVYTEADTYLYIDSPSDNGSGLLGHKLLAGKSATSAGYRSALVVDGDSTDSYAYGGLILTKGAALPNGISWPYGIDDADEAVDAGGKPVDIGKHIWITGTWLTHTNSYNGGTSYRGSVETIIAAKLATVPANREPIGRSNGRVNSVSNVPRIHSAQIDALTQLRYVTIRNEDGIGPIITSMRTAAHPDSDYAKASTIRCINYVASQIRRRAHAFIGEPLDSQRLAALQSDLDGTLLASRQQGYHQGARALIKLTREGKIQGKFSIVLRMVPPFTAEEITLEISVAADEGEL